MLIASNSLTRWSPFCVGVRKAKEGSVSIRRKRQRFSRNGGRATRPRDVSSSFMAQPSAKRTPGIRNRCAGPWFASFYGASPPPPAAALAAAFGAPFASAFGGRAAAAGRSAVGVLPPTSFMRLSK